MTTCNLWHIFSIIFVLVKSINFDYDFTIFCFVILYRFYKSKWVKSFDFDCDFTIFNFVIAHLIWNNIQIITTLVLVFNVQNTIILCAKATKLLWLKQYFFHYKIKLFVQNNVWLCLTFDFKFGLFFFFVK